VRISAMLFLPPKHLGASLTYFSVLCASLIDACWLTGEAPRWREVMISAGDGKTS
jgi:hypothetical protein